MKTIFQVDLALAKAETSAGVASKTMDLPFLPSTEVQIETSLWPAKSKIREVIMNLDDPHVRIYLGKEWVQDWDDFNTKSDVYKSFGWEVAKY